MESCRIFTLTLVPLFLCFFHSPVFSAITFNPTSSAVLLTDSGGEALVSAGQTFQLGFFTPNGSNGRNLGIWYRDQPTTIVWVANREVGLPNSTGFLCFTPDGNLQIFDGNNDSYWSTDLGKSPSSGSFNYTLDLLDSGNLVFTGGENKSTIWQSFDNPTDTFLPGMKMIPNFNLTSWYSPDDPSAGNFLFLIDETTPQRTQLVILNNSIPFWISGVQSGFRRVPQFIYDFLTNSSGSIYDNNITITRGNDYSNSRLVMNYDGRIQFFQTARDPAPSWSEPSNICSLVSACGSFGICNGGYRVPCRCLPGFVPKSAENWRSGDFSEGCTRVSQTCSKDGNFLKMKVAKVERPNGVNQDFDDEDGCRGWCSGNCNCQAYSFEQVEKGETTACSFWTDDLKDAEETGAADRSLTLNLRVSVSDLESTKKDCKPCGTNTIPYPLSTGPSCGDELYSSFKCDNNTGLLTFNVLNASYTVTRIEKQLLKFFIQVGDEYCGNSTNSQAKVMELDQSLPFTVNGGCNADSVNLSLARFRGGKVSSELEIEWEIPAEPLCRSEEDCNDWPNSSCRQVGGDSGDRRCLCSESSRWDWVNVTCSLRPGLSNVGSSTSKRRRLLYLAIFGSLGGLLIVTLASVVILFLKTKGRKLRVEGSNDGKDENLAFRLYDGEKRMKEFMNSGEFGEDDKKDIDVPFFDLECIYSATDSFSHSNKLGQGGFGPVYKGKFPGGQEIAVKRLSSVSTQGLEEFKNEVVLIAKLQHRNLVRLLGYCVDGSEKMLLYEYMPNKSLDSFIFDRNRCVLLNWETRFNIIMGITRGMLYLHHDSRLTIVHRDLKTSNVLLDEEMEPKISDFGMARIVAAKQTEINTARVVGTYGYMSPEYALDGKFSTKSDVFSFGVVVLEILSGQKNTGFYKSADGISLLSHAWERWREGNVMEVMEQSLMETCNGSEFTRCVNVALLCVQEDANDRPSMANVVMMLGSESASLPRPKEPAFSIRRHEPGYASTTASPSSTSHGTMETTTELEGR